MAQNDKICWVVDLGTIPYAEGLVLQRHVVAARKAGRVPDVLLLCQHPHVITLGRSGRREHLLGSARLLEQMGVAFCESDRGGDITYHGPGQLVGYPILELSEICKDVVWYVRGLEEAMIRAAADFGLAAHRIEGKTGLWVEGAAGPPEKLAAIGVHISRWVTSHGFAFNVSTDLRYFDLIVPCGIRDCRAASLEKLLGRAVNDEAVAKAIVARFAEVFARDMRAASRRELEARLAPSAQDAREPAAARA